MTARAKIDLEFALSRSTKYSNKVTVVRDLMCMSNIYQVVTPRRTATELVDQLRKADFQWKLVSKRGCKCQLRHRKESLSDLSLSVLS